MVKNSRPPKSKILLRRFFSETHLDASGQHIDLPPQETRHLQDSLRLLEGDQCLIVDGHGGEAVAQILRFNRDGSTSVRVAHLRKKEQKVSQILKNSISLCVALPQRGKMEDMLEKSQEFGVGEYFPMVTDRTMVKISKEKTKKVFERWQKTLKEACKQSGELVLTRLYPLQDFAKVFDHVRPQDHVLVLHPGEGGLGIKDWVAKFQRQMTRAPGKIVVLIGPEGGFTENEVTLAESKGAQKISLGPSILKMDTALYAMTAILKWMVA